MKKLFCTLVFLSIPSLVWAVECNSPKICTLKASEVCANQKLKLLGEDECIECNCPEGDEEKIVDGESDCCKNNFRWDDSVKKYILPAPYICGCPDGGVLKEIDNDFFCCKGTMVLLGTGYDINDPLICGCPSGQERTSMNDCCNSSKIIEEGTRKTCCEHSVATKADGKKVCCASGQEAIKPKGSSDEICCNADKVVEADTGKICCENDVIVKSDGKKECCAKVTTDKSRLCPCKTGEEEVYYFDNEIKTTYKCCPFDTKPLHFSGECCTPDKTYPETYITKSGYQLGDWWIGNYRTSSDSKKKCCTDGTLVDYETLEYSEKKTIKICCDSVPSCDPGKGVIYQDESGKCQCGCMNNYDCNLNWKEGDIVHYCQADHTCAKAISFDISGIEVEINNFAGGKFTQKKAEALVRKIRENLLASTGNDKVKMVFSGEFIDSHLEDTTGYSKNGDKLTIHINAGYCKESDAGEFDCQATIVHENVHRVDNLVQPKWDEAHRVITNLYQRCLTEIHAQAVGALTKVRAGFENCYRYKDGGVFPVCAPLKDFDPVACARCEGVYKSFIWGESYARKYMNYGDAKKYYTDPAWSQDNNCNGLQAQLEEDFTNSPYAERAYWSERRKDAKYILDQVTPTVLNAVHEVKEASSWDQGLFGMISRTGFLWDSSSPNLVSDIAQLYSEHATLCMSPQRFMNHPAIQLGFEKVSSIPEFEQAYDFIQSNPICKKPGFAVGDYVLPECQEILNCIGDEWRNGCWPNAEWASYIGQTETYTVN